MGSLQYYYSSLTTHGPYSLLLTHLVSVVSTSVMAGMAKGMDALLRYSV